ncbi:twin-arginine translocase subunit TatC [Streptomyces sp. NRRL B-1677]|uniref:Sec-independent protein translocase protein TatC n=1 Tax=Streptomyces klenkii TaxID=1420899 RepID=A0A3B0B0Q5_9ACTN|nr:MULTISPECIES: twin-arginine translocase subunit TatC [Streptomyces]MBF6048658.1 twin-arginine translocase subunit TatC [Streptomyces sp. NRRL B-1677]RKN65547.1 twin-arginine translocase subunit TatC [Streptomyces klenkii]
MPLAEHLRELRNRLAKAVLAIIVVAIVAAFYQKQLTDFLSSPVPKCPGRDLAQSHGGNCAIVVFNSLSSPFTTIVKICLLAGVTVSSPIWLYQLWAFLAPGLHKSEKKYTVAFVATAAPLFVAGAWLAYEIMPMSMRVLLQITPDSAANTLNLDDILDFTVRMILVFGLAFELPLLLVMMNIAGMVTGKTMVKWWRGVVMGTFVFGAVATPSTDPFGMCILAVPIIILYFGAVGFSMLNDKRRERRNPDHLLSDDEAAPLDLSPQPLGDSEPMPALHEGSEGGRRETARTSYDDVT